MIWQPIDSAPRDETAILLWRKNAIPLVGYTGPGRSDWWLRGCAGSVWFDPTHWMPLPEPPNAAEAIGRKA